MYLAAASLQVKKKIVIPKELCQRFRTEDVSKGVLQDSVLGPVLSISRNALESEVPNFAENTKLFKMVKMKADSKELQKSIRFHL